jgi:hypothetical protein
VVNIKQYYVYQLVDPRNNKPFYIGKGQGKRIDAHEREAKANIISPKCNLIREIELEGLKIVKHIVKYFAVEMSAYKYEKKLIKKIGLSNLTNLTEGGTGIYPFKPSDPELIYDTALVSTLSVLIRKTKGNFKDASFTFGGKKHDLGDKIENIVKISFKRLISNRNSEWLHTEFKKHNISLELVTNQ